MAVDTAESGDGWQTGVSAFEAGPPDAERESGQGGSLYIYNQSTRT